MAFLRGYYLASPTFLIDFPVGERFGSLVDGRLEGDLIHETERGKRWVYKQFTRRTWRLNFRVSETDLQFFRTLHDAVGGSETAFYFVEDVTTFTTAGDSIGLDVLVRKEQHFDPHELTDPGVVLGVEMPFYDYTLELTEEPTDAEIDA